MDYDYSLQHIAWEDFHALDLKKKGRYFQQDGRLCHALIAQQFDRDSLEKLCRLATRLRRIGKSKEGLLFLRRQLAAQRAMLYFVQPSTRTFLSFYAACQILGMQPAEVRDTNTSSEVKGESPEDTIRTLSSYFDILIMRHPVGGFAERIAWLLSNTERPVPVVNAGSGKDQHPTQALLDVYTLMRSFEERGGIDGKHIAFVGDLARGRTVRSLATLLTHFDDVRQTFVAPQALQIGDDILEDLARAGTEVRRTECFEDVIPEVDAIYMTRIQDEWDLHGESRKIETAQYHFEARHLEKLKPHAVLMHPLPRRDEIAVEVDRDPRAVYWRQVRNGMWVRAALMLSMFGCEHQVDDFPGEVKDT